MIDANSGQHVWAERYDRNIEDIFDLQDEIVQNIAAATETRVYLNESARAARVQRSLGPLDRNYRAFDGLIKGTASDVTKARQILEEVLRDYPDDMMATGLLAGTYWTAVLLDFSDDRISDLKKSEELARRVIAGDESLDYGHLHLAATLAFLGKYDQALRSIGRLNSIRIRP